MNPPHELHRGRQNAKTAQGKRGARAAGETGPGESMVQCGPGWLTSTGLFYRCPTQPAPLHPLSLFLFLLTICSWWYHGLPRCPREKTGHRPQFLLLYLSLSTFNQCRSIQSSLKSILSKTPRTHSFCLLCSAGSKFIFLLGYWNTAHLSVGLQIQNSLPVLYLDTIPTLPFRSYV